MLYVVCVMIQMTIEHTESNIKIIWEIPISAKMNLNSRKIAEEQQTQQEINIIKNIFYVNIDLLSISSKC